VTAGVDAEMVIDRGGHILRIGGRSTTRSPRGWTCNDLPHFHAAAAHQHAERIAPVVAAVSRVHPRRAAEFAHRYDKRLVVQPAVNEVGDEAAIARSSGGISCLAPPRFSLR
jgi:hypothetical protein